jgi:chromosome segregation ATPase
MNAARLTRRWQEAAGDPARMVEALVDEINDPATGLVTRDFLRAELAQVREELAALRGELRSEITAVRGEIIGIRGELRSEIAAVRGEIAAVRGEIAAVRGEIWRVVLTVFGAQVVLVGILVTILFQVVR